MNAKLNAFASACYMLAFCLNIEGDYAAVLFLASVAHGVLTTYALDHNL